MDSVTQGIASLLGEQSPEVILPLQQAEEVVKEGDNLIGLLESFDLPGAKLAVSGLMRSLGFGPEADGIATVLIGLFVVLVLVGYAAGPKTTDHVGQKPPTDTNEKK
jgi:hypothetical protein